MSANVSDFLLERLSQWGVKRIFGYPGDGINGILGGLGRHQDLFEFVQVRHEERGRDALARDVSEEEHELARVNRGLSGQHPPQHGEPVGPVHAPVVDVSDQGREILQGRSCPLAAHPHPPRA